MRAVVLLRVYTFGSIAESRGEGKWSFCEEDKKKHLSFEQVLVCPIRWVLVPIEFGAAFPTCRLTVFVPPRDATEVIGKRRLHALFGIAD